MRGYILDRTYRTIRSRHHMETIKRMNDRFGRSTSAATLIRRAPGRILWRINGQLILLPFRTKTSDSIVGPCHERIGAKYVNGTKPQQELGKNVSSSISGTGPYALSRTLTHVSDSGGMEIVPRLNLPSEEPVTITSRGKGGGTN